jgi:hypothetical protein
VQLGDVELRLLTRFLGHDGTSLVVDPEHELLRMRAAEAEDPSQHHRHVRHEVDRIVPYDHEPRPGPFGILDDGPERIEDRIEQRRPLPRSVRGDDADDSGISGDGDVPCDADDRTPRARPRTAAQPWCGRRANRGAPHV